MYLDLKTFYRPNVNLPSLFYVNFCKSLRTSVIEDQSTTMTITPDKLWCIASIIVSDFCIIFPPYNLVTIRLYFSLLLTKIPKVYLPNIQEIYICSWLQLKIVASSKWMCAAKWVLTGKPDFELTVLFFMFCFSYYNMSFVNFTLFTQKRKNARTSDRTIWHLIELN